MKAKQITTIFARLQQHNPEPTTELHYRNEFELLIAVMLSAQATDKSVNAATTALFQAAPTAAKMLRLGEEALKKYIKTIGLFNSKAKNIIATCAILQNQYKGQIPRERNQLEALPGVGRKTANVILNTAFGQATIAVDTHLFRIARRIGLSDGKTVRAVEDQLVKVIPKPYLQNAHHWLILHGRYTCKARKPLCSQCCIADLCEYPDKVYD